MKEPNINFGKHTHTSLASLPFPLPLGIALHSLLKPTHCSKLTAPRKSAREAHERLSLFERIQQEILNESVLALLLHACASDLAAL